MTRVLVLNGPNLHRLGTREPELYGTATLADIVSSLQQQARALQHTLEHYQSNAEHELVERVHQASDDGVNWILLNPGAFTHTSVALRDALLATKIPFIEIHLSNVAARESFRQQNYFSDIAHGSITGLGPMGYELGLRAIHAQSQGQSEES